MAASCGRTDGTSAGVVAELQETGNLLLLDGERRVVWQRFDHPMDTLLPGQPLTRSLRLVSIAGKGISTKGYYVSHFNDDNVLSFITIFRVDRVNIKTEYEKLKTSEKQSLSLIHSFDEWIFIHC
ncbi:hypothetical protein EJ110_NYTH49033 [Nymphaea thermarum]|nr:hypothetical protein EJ110_NYTH49033 [Nymphaea thermarum]